MSRYSNGIYGSGMYDFVKQKVNEQNRKIKIVFEEKQNNLTKNQRYAMNHKSNKTCTPTPSSRLSMRKEIYKNGQLARVQGVGTRSGGFLGSEGNGDVNYIGYSLFGFSEDKQILFDPDGGTKFETPVIFDNDVTIGGNISLTDITVDNLSSRDGITTSGTIESDYLVVRHLLSVSGDLVRIGEHNVNGTDYVLSVSGESIFQDRITVQNGISSLSDRRLKQNILPIEYAMSKIENMRGVYYTMCDRPQIGFIAQDMKDILPEVVHQDGRGYYSIEYGNIVALLVEGMKELRRENREKDQKIDALEARLAKIEERLGI